MTPLGLLHDFVSALPPEVCAALDDVSSTRSLPKGGHLLRAGVTPEAVFQVREGRVKYRTWDHAGRETVLTYMTRGDWVGLAEVFTGLPAMWDVVAQSPVTLRVIGHAEFGRLVAQHSALSRELLRVFALRFSLYRLFGLDHSALSPKERLIKMLYFLSFGHQKDESDTQPIFLQLSQQELCKVVGASRQKLNPALKALEQEQLLTVQFGGVLLHGRACIVERYGHLLDLTPSTRPAAGRLSPR